MNKKGFTLIELLVVIAIIGILAVAFLPSLLDAPARARDTKRIADIERIQKVLIDGDLTGTGYPSESVAIKNDTFGDYLVSLGGAIPSDPQSDNHVATGCAGNYLYLAGSSTSDYSFGLFARVEDTNNGNYDCDTTALQACTTTTAVDLDTLTLEDTGDCFARLVQ